MASLRDAVKDYQGELQDGIAWVAFWREGRSWDSGYLYLEMDDTISPEDIGWLKEARDKDPAAVVVNTYYCGHFGEGMNLDELTAGVRWNYENGCNLLSDFIECRSNELTQEAQEQEPEQDNSVFLPETATSVVIYEDNGGGIDAVVKRGGVLCNVVSNLERERGITGGKILAAAKEGFPYADPYDPEEWGGLEMNAVADEIDAMAKPIVEVYHNETVYRYENMGVEGSRLFGNPLYDFAESSELEITPELGSL